MKLHEMARAAIICDKCGKPTAGNHYWYKNEKRCKSSARSDMGVASDNAGLSSWLEVATNQFQQAGGNTPGIPTSIDVQSGGMGDVGEVTFTFKDTDPTAAKLWVQDFIAQRNLPATSVLVGGVGDGADNWVEVYVVV